MAGDEWVEQFWLEWPKDESLDHRALAVQLAVRGYDMDRNVDPTDVLIDTYRSSGATACQRVSIRKRVVDQRTPSTVLRIPMRELVPPGSSAPCRRVRELGTDDLKQRLREGPVRFAFANVGLPLGWVDPSRCFDVWKVEVRHHLVEPDEPIRLDDLPGGYGYLASEWAGSSPDDAVVLFEVHH